MIKVEEEIKLYSTEKLERYPHNMLLFKYGDDTIGTIQLKYNDENLWQKAIDYINKVKNGSAQ